MGPGRVREEPAVARRRRRRRLLALAAAGLALGLLYAARGWYLPAAARYLDVSTPPRPADYVLILGGGADTRPFVAAALYKAGLAKQVLVPAPKPSPAAEDGLLPPESEVTRRVLLARGVPPEALVVLPAEVSSTFDEARGLARFLEDRPDATVAVVTTTHHTRRSSWIFRKELGDRAARLQFVAAPTEGYGPDDWWQTEEGFQAYANEYVKLAYYLVRY